MAEATAEAKGVFKGLDTITGADLDADKAFLQWCLANNVKAPSLLYPFWDAHGIRGLGVKEPIVGASAGLPLVEVPIRLLITPSVAKADPLVGPIFSSPGPSLGPLLDDVDVLLGTYLAYQTSRGSESPYAPWMAVIPKGLESLDEWSDKELEELQNETLAQAARQKHKTLAETGKKIATHLSSKHPSVFPPSMFTPALVSWGIATVSARAYGRRLPEPALVPFADCFNHNCGARVKYGFGKRVYEEAHQEEGESTAATPSAETSGLVGPMAWCKGDDRDGGGRPSLDPDTAVFRLWPSNGQHYPTAGLEVHNSYGRRDNRHLALEYGFCLPNNEWDNVVLKPGAVSDCGNLFSLTTADYYYCEYEDENEDEDEDEEQEDGDDSKDDEEAGGNEAAAKSPEQLLREQHLARPLPIVSLSKRNFLSKLDLMPLGSLRVIARGSVEGGGSGGGWCGPDLLPLFRALACVTAEEERRVVYEQEKHALLWKAKQHSSDRLERRARTEKALALRHCGVLVDEGMMVGLTSSASSAGVVTAVCAADDDEVDPNEVDLAEEGLALQGARIMKEALQLDQATLLAKGTPLEKDEGDAADGGKIDIDARSHDSDIDGDWPQHPKDPPPSVLTRPLGLANEDRALRLLVRYLETCLDSMPTSIKQDQRLLKSKVAPYRLRVALLYRLSRKRILKEQIKQTRAVLQVLSLEVRRFKALFGGNGSETHASVPQYCLRSSLLGGHGSGAYFAGGGGGGAGSQLGRLWLQEVARALLQDSDGDGNDDDQAAAGGAGTKPVGSSGIIRSSGKEGRTERGLRALIDVQASADALFAKAVLYRSSHASGSGGDDGTATTAAASSSLFEEARQAVLRGPLLPSVPSFFEWDHGLLTGETLKEKERRFAKKAAVEDAEGSGGAGGGKKKGGAAGAKKKR